MSTSLLASRAPANRVRIRPSRLGRRIIRVLARFAIRLSSGCFNSSEFIFEVITKKKTDCLS